MFSAGTPASCSGGVLCRASRDSRENEGLTTRMSDETQPAEPVSGERVPAVTVGLFGPRRLVKTMTEVSQEVAERSAHGVRFLTGGDPAQAARPARCLPLPARMRQARCARPPASARP